MAIGSLNFRLGLDMSEFADGLTSADSALGRFAAGVQAQFRSMEAQLTRVGAGLTAAVTVPFGLMARSASRAAGDFESAMNRVQSALRPLTPRQIERLRAAALQMGPTVGLSATQAAEAIETLGLAGMSAEAILGGGLQQTLVLARANLGEVEAAAALASDVLRQFNMVSSDLPRIVQQVTGALDTSKFGFDDFRLAIAQGGAAAGEAGLRFEEFSAGLAATAAQFASGADAGTSFKAFLNGLTPDSDEAKRTMEQLGLRFYDARGQFLGLAHAAEELRAKLTPLSDRTRSQALTTLFGTDGMRTAIGLMQAGRSEIERLQQVIGRTDVQEKLAIQMRGLNQAFVNLSNAAERLKIALGDAGLLAVMTALAGGLASLTGAIANVPSGFLSAYLAVGAFAALIGPLILVLTKLGPLLLGLRLGTSLWATALLAVLNPVALLVIVLGNLATRFGMVRAAALLTSSAMVRFAGIVGIVVTALMVLSPALMSNATASEWAMQAADNASQAYARMQERISQLANASGRFRQELQRQIQAMQAAAVVQGALLRAQATGLESRARAARGMDAADPNPQNRIGRRILRRYDWMDDPAELEALAAELRRGAGEADRTYQAAQQALVRDRSRPVGGVDLPDLGAAPERERNKRERESNAEDIAHRREMLALNQQLAVARAAEDIDTARQIERQVQLIERTREYRDLEVPAAEARARAQADMNALREAERLSMDRNLAIGDEAVEIEVARALGAWGTVRQLEHERDLRREMLELQNAGLLAQAASERAGERMVRRQQGEIGAWRRTLAERRAEHELNLARARGDTQRVRQMEREMQIERLTRDLRRDSNGLMGEDEARRQATSEVDEAEEARLTGVFRDTFREGVMAALNGDFGKWFERWWTDQLTRSLEDALNQVADLLRSILTGATGKGGSFLEGAGGLLGSLFGGGLSPKVAGGDLGFVGGVTNPLKGLPGFKTGGSFEVGGGPGPDENLVTFWATRGEMVNVSKGDEERRPAAPRVVVNQHNNFAGGAVTRDDLAQMHRVTIAGAQAAMADQRRRSGRGGW